MLRVSSVALAAVAGFATLLLLPATRWAVSNHMDMILGRIHVARTGGFDIRQQVGALGTYTPSSASSPNQWQATDQIAEFGIAVARTATFTGGTAHDPYKRFLPLREYCAKYQRDLAARAVYGCYATQGITTPRPFGAAAPDGESARLRRASALEVLNAVNGADALEPENAIFPLLRSMALGALGREEEAATAFHLASTKSEYQMHVRPAIEAQWHAFESTYGYRGEEVRVNALAGYMLPQDSILRSESKWLIGREGIRGRVAVARLARLMALKSDVAIDLFVATSAFADSLLGPRVDGSNRLEPSMENFVAGADILDRDPVRGDFSFVAALADMRPLLDRDAKYMVSVNLASSLLETPRVLCSAVALLVALMAFPAIALLRWASALKFTSSRGRAALPYFAWLTILLTGSQENTFGLLSVAVIAFLLFVAACLVPYREAQGDAAPSVATDRQSAGVLGFRGWSGATVVRICAYALVALTLACSWIDWPAGFAVALAFVLADVFSHWTLTGKIAGGLTVLVTEIALTIFVWALLLRIADDPGIRMLPFVAVPLVAMALVPRGKFWPKWSASAVLATASLAYLACVGWEVRDNNALIKADQNWIQEATEYRHSLGMTAA